MKFRKIVPVLFSMAFCFSSTMFPALPAHAAAHNGSGTASVNVTVTAGDVDDGTGGQIPDDDGDAGDKIPGGSGTGGQKPGSDGGDDAKPGQDGGGSATDTDKDKDSGGGDKSKDKDKNKDKDKSKDKDKNKDRNKGKDKDKSKDKGKDLSGKQNSADDKGAGDGNGDTGNGAGGSSGNQNPSGHSAVPPASGGPAGRKPDAYPGLEKNLDDGGGNSKGDEGAVNNASGSKNEQGDDGKSEGADVETGESGSGGEPGDDGGESGGTGGSGSEMDGFVKMALQYWKQAVLAVLALAASVFAVFYARRRIRFHGILADKEIDGVLFRRDMDSVNGTVIVPELIGKLNGGGISFEEYEDLVMGSGDVTLLPAGTKMYISVTDAGMDETWPAEKADERRMFGRLGEAASLAQMKGRMVLADVVLKQERKGIEIPLHFVFR